MARLNLMYFAALAAGFITTCHGVPVLEEMQNNQRNTAITNSYFITTWSHIVNGTENEAVANTAEGVALLDYLDGTQTVAIIVHGRESTVFSEFGHTLRSTLLERDQESVVILVDWSAASQSSYDEARSLVPQVAQDLSDFIVLLEEGEKLDRGLLHLIGFDLGAHVVGITSRIAASRARKITALSPAGVGWDLFSQRLRSTDAQFVEVIHTDAVGARAFGIRETSGTLDFFPNGATRQPGCTASDNSCHHNRSWQLFAATVQMGGHLTGIRCDTLTQALNNRCTGLGVAVMGTNALIKPA
ncbi:hypothetical protein MSG28_001411 [Choristoneura fumiferana]|uniref:Uncharacterized protein n=2 Tax=Choristoneura fumiferana TaxID=7141 RepID=A0ACC0KTN3_CHOFU|nr:hypothetical protein MSG28_001411 [Choristoneura fumiferana]